MHYIMSFSQKRPFVACTSWQFVKILRFMWIFLKFLLKFLTDVQFSDLFIVRRVYFVCQLQKLFYLETVLFLDIWLHPRFFREEESSWALVSEEFWLRKHSDRTKHLVFIDQIKPFWLKKVVKIIVFNLFHFISSLRTSPTSMRYGFI